MRLIKVIILVFFSTNLFAQVGSVRDKLPYKAGEPFVILQYSESFYLVFKIDYCHEYYMEKISGISDEVKVKKTLETIEKIYNSYYVSDILSQDYIDDALLLELFKRKKILVFSKHEDLLVNERYKIRYKVSSGGMLVKLKRNNQIIFGMKCFGRLK
ncbi:MAG: hypothetical protein ACOCWG_04855 [bacterium]